MKNKLSLLTASVLFALPALAPAAVTVNIVNGDAAGVGFNDTTAATPVGGNNGTTIGQQRLIAYQRAAQVWSNTLSTNVPSAVTVNVYATWEALTCTATSATLGSAGAAEVFSDFPNAPFAATWYSAALANKISGVDNSTATVTPPTTGVPTKYQIRARFNVNLGQANCLSGSPFYLGLDNNPPASQTDLLVVLIHEIGHGLGFQTFTSGSTGAYLSNQPSIWDRYLTDGNTNQTWVQFTAAQRAASAISDRLVWGGQLVTSQVPSVLQQGTPNLKVTLPSTGLTTYAVGTASFGPALSSPGITAQIGQVIDTAGNNGLACNPNDATAAATLSPANAAAVNGKIALVDRGTCGFVIKVKACQDAGAIGVIVVDNAAGSPPAGLGGADPNITIPAVRVTQSDGAAIKAALERRSRTSPANVTATLGLDLSVRAGADASNRAKMYSPNPFISGSSVSHYDVSATPNLIMEPNINVGLGQSVVPPADLTYTLLRETGW